MSTGDPAQRARVRCPHCRANNFLGQPQCWQCNALLTGLASSGPVPLPADNDKKMQAMLLRLIVLFTMALIVGAISATVYHLSGQARSDRPTAPQVIPPAHHSSAPLRTPENNSPNPSATVPMQTPPAASSHTNANSTSTDPAVIDQAKREVERAKSEMHLPPNAIGSDGLVHLQGGGTLTREQWEAARKKLQEGSDSTNAPSTSP